MIEKETILLERCAAHGDAKALKMQVQQYASMVYGTAWRIVQHEDSAADVTRQTFLELMCQGDKIFESTGIWLHQVATKKAIDFHRRSAFSKSREQTTFQTHSASGRTWQGLSSYLDEALEEFDAPLKALLLDHFLIGKTTTEISREEGISPEAVACRVHDGLEQLRGLLRHRGLLFTEAVLHAMLTENTRQATPKELLLELAEMKLGGGALKVRGVPGSRLALCAKNHLYRNVLIAFALVGIAAIAGYVYYSRSSQVPPAQVISIQTHPEELAPEATTAKPQPALDKPVLRSGLIDRAMHTNWSTPENAVRSLMKLFEQRADDELKAYLAQGTGESPDSAYLKFLGGPIEIIEVIQEENTAQVTYLAAVHTEFALNNTIWLPGDALTLSARFLWINDLWKCLAINSASFEGDLNETEQNTQ